MAQNADQCNIGSIFQIFSLVSDVYQMKKIVIISILFFLGALWSSAHISLAEDGDRPNGAVLELRISHKVREVEGWKVNVDESLLQGEHKDDGDLALKILSQRLHRIILRLPEKPRIEMQKVPIYLDRAHPLGNAHFHPGKKWLVDHGYDPAMTEAVHLTHVGILLNDGRQPDVGDVVLHELTHAYHFKVLGFEHEGILEGYQVFCDSQKFDAVTYPNGRQRPHYGLMNHKEFFAEMTETFFTKNNSYPFNRTELMLYHPESYRLMSQIWGVKVPEPRGTWAENPTAWDLRMLATLKSQRGQHAEAIKMVKRAQKLEPQNERLDTLLETLEAAKRASE